MVIGTDFVFAFWATPMGIITAKLSWLITSWELIIELVILPYQVGYVVGGCYPPYA